ncbi:MAG: cytochrome c oxidase subunit 3 [Terracidiphilus sp.]|jgi:cytochrome c oxidase subunit 3
MPSIFTPSPAEIERKDPGIGGKPPLDRRPTGGGGGGDDDWKNQRRGPRELLHRVRFFVFAFLAADMVVFAVLVVAFYARQAGGHTFELIGDWHPVQLPPILYLNTAVLLLSTLTMEWARQSIFREIDVLEEWLGLGKPALRRTLPWVAATLFFGSLFLAGQWTAWRQLTAQGFAFDKNVTPASYFFYIITGWHAGHLIFCIAALVFCLVGLGMFRRVEYRQIAIDTTAWCWHTMGLVWLALWAVLTFGQ